MAVVIELNKSYSFNTVSYKVLAPNYTGVKNTAKMGFKQILSYPTDMYNDVVSIHQKLVSEGVANLTAPEEETYFIFEDSYGVEICMGSSWIDHPTIVLVTGILLKLDIASISTGDVPIILGTLNSLGYNNIDSTIITT